MNDDTVGSPGSPCLVYLYVDGTWTVRPNYSAAPLSPPSPVSQLAYAEIVPRSFVVANNSIL